MTDFDRREVLGAAAGAGLMGLALRGFSADAAPGDLRRATTRLRFSEPAAEWVDALPLGNGFMGAMPFGRIGTERILLNHDELWTGRPDTASQAATLATLPEVRRLLFAGDYAAANKLAQDRMMAPMPESFGSFQMLADLNLAFDHDDGGADYERELDMADGVATTRFTIGGARHTRTVFASHPAGVIVVRLETDAPAGLSLAATLSRPADATFVHDGGLMAMTGRPRPQGTAFAAHMAQRIQGGGASPIAGGWRIAGAKSVTLVLAAATDLRRPDPITRSRAAAVAAAATPYVQLLAAHLADHRPLFGACSVELGASRPVSLGSPGQVAQNPQLAEAMFNLGRYLLIGSSRSGSMPANLQGLWADGLEPPWSSDYHVNINIQMNYWAADACGLGILNAPLFDFTERLLPSARRTARASYGCRGAVMHYTTNVWGHTALDGLLLYGLWPDGLAWLAQHFWDHWLHTGDRGFLATRAFPVLKACAEFSLDYLVRHPKTGRLVAGPAASPENEYVLPGGSGKRGNGAIVMGPAISQSIAHAVLTHTAEAARLLGGEADLVARCTAAAAALQPLQIGADSRIMEWPEPFVEVEPGHRHLSHLWALHPGDAIDRDGTPALAAAAAKSLAVRAAPSSDRQGWSAVWAMAMFARLGNAEGAFAMYQRYVARQATPAALNTFLAKPAKFQIDANFGVVAALVEMLLQSRDGVLRLLPALPRQWANEGRVRNLRAKGGMAVDIVWRDGRAVEATLYPARAGCWQIVPPPGQRITGVDGSNLTGDGRMTLKAGRTYRVALGERTDPATGP